MTEIRRWGSRETQPRAIYVLFVLLMSTAPALQTSSNDITVEEATKADAEIARRSFLRLHAARGIESSSSEYKSLAYMRLNSRIPTIAPLFQLFLPFTQALLTRFFFTDSRRPAEQHRRNEHVP